jgi:hypothetical protein
MSAAAAVAVLIGPQLFGQGAVDERFRTRDGLPDLQGVWRFSTITPLERPGEFADKPFLTTDEAKVYQERRLAALNLDKSSERAGLSGPSVNEFWSERDDLVTVGGRFPTSLVVDPPNGRIPQLTSDRQARVAERAAARLLGVGPEAFSSSERCFRDARPPFFPSADKGLIEIIQTSELVVIRQENLHETRIIPFDGRPHLPPVFRSWIGDPRGVWEGDVLVVDSTNFTDLGDRFDENLHLVERFSRIDRDTLLYEFTIDDPTVYTQPWTVAMAMKRSTDLLFEDACHEGNYSMRNILRAIRMREAQTR